MLIPDHTGHSTVQWEQRDVTSTALAADQFDALLAQRLRPFERVGPQQYEPLHSFAPDADEILWVRPLQGG
jgi:hypothetical protein